jgi:hypothetical protein
MGTREWRYASVILLLLALLTVKSLVLDGVKDLSGEEAEFARYVAQSIESQEKWAINKTDALSYKIVRIKKINEETATITTDEEKKNSIELSGHYTARVRKYILWILPYGDFSISIENK